MKRLLPKTPTNRIILDLDDVTVNMGEVLTPAMNDYTGLNKCMSTWHTYNITDHYPMVDQRKFADIVVNYNLFERAQPFDGAIAATHRLKQLGYDIHVVTSRGFHPDALNLTHTWLQEHGAAFDELHIVPDGATKSSVYGKIGKFDFIVDDHIGNIYDAIDSKLVKRMVVITQPWNNFSIPDKVVRFDYLWQFVDKLELAHNAT